MLRFSTPIPSVFNFQFLIFNFLTMSFYRKVYNKKFGVWYPSAVVMGQPVPVK